MKEDTGKLFVHKTTKAAPILLLSQRALPLIKDCALLIEVKFSEAG